MKLKEALEKKKFTVTSEIQTPFDEDPASLMKALESVRERVDGFSVVETEINGVVGDSIKICKELQNNRFEAVYRTTIRDKSRPKLLKDLALAHKSGVENILTFTEFYRISGDSLQEMMFFHVDSGKLQSVLEHLSEGRNVDGHELPSKASFLVGAGVDCRWGSDVPSMELKEMESMRELGTGFFLTTPVFEIDRFEKFMRQAKQIGVPVIAEVMILKTAGMGSFMNRHVNPNMVPEHVIRKLAKSTDRQKSSIEIFAETVRGLKEICQGVHIITIGAESKLKLYLDAAKLY
ncbi:MAG: methylenetetrahydrofolate reductase [Deltaproteobacteria bacterium HGW-Deltaproteobacteria-21]|nr:MAG: methylenetetrahydrofolate reductase [Deltaproteobacteria bacterium HGW-Deltaproteobacteria-21]